MPDAKSGRIPLTALFNPKYGEEFTLNMIRADLGLDPIEGCDEVMVRHKGGIYFKDSEEQYLKLLEEKGQ